MFDDALKLKDRNKKRKAFIYAVGTTFFIAIIYILLNKGSLYKFGGIGKDVKPMASFVKETTDTVSSNINKGKSVINKK
jgi:hypothetical protein